MAANSADQTVKIVPAQLSFLAIFNPTLGKTDQTFQDQVVFYYSQVARARKKSGTQGTAADRKLQEEENEKLRQIGLAQGMANFAKSFSGGQNIDSIETERSRIVMHELEPNWWILAVSLSRNDCSTHLTFAVYRSYNHSALGLTRAQERNKRDVDS
jgi:hypothetical protein